LTVVYFSGSDSDPNNPLMWVQYGELPACVANTDRFGSFVCDCGNHTVQRDKTVDPFDSQDRIACVVMTRESTENSSL